MIYVVFVLLVVPSAATAQDKAAKIREVLTLASRYGQFNGAALVAENGRVIVKQGYGMANMEWNIPNTPETRFRLGSITKQFTAMLTLQLVNQGKLKLDGNLSDYLPDYRQDTGGRITIHHLLTHTSGIPSYTNLPAFFEDVSRNPYTVADFVKRYASRDLEFEPGTKFSYNNSGYFLLGAIIEKVTGKSYEQVLQENVLTPLGMTNTGYDHYDRIIARRASGYVKSRDGYVNAPYLDMSIPYAAGSLYSTVEDLYLWDQALYTDKLIPAALKEQMHKPFLDNYAYGWAVGNLPFKGDDGPVQAISHDGGINGFNTTIVRFTGRKHLIVLLDNTSQGQSLDRLKREIARILYDQPYELPKMSGADLLLKTILEKGVDAGVAQYRDLKTKQSSTYELGETELNTLGYQLLGAGKPKEAITIFKLNVEAYPQSSNVYDSLGEAYLLGGEYDLAVLNYKKSLELNSQNTNAVEALKKLEGKPATIDPKVFDAYVGEYQVAPTFSVTVFREGDKLMTQATGQSKFEIFPESETTFFFRVVNAKITFNKDEGGRVVGLTINQGGRDVPAKKVK